MILRRGTVVRLQTGTIVMVADRGSPLGWNCVPLASDNPAYQPGGWDIFVFEEDLRDGLEIDMRQFLIKEPQ